MAFHPGAPAQLIRSGADMEDIDSDGLIPYPQMSKDVLRVLHGHLPDGMSIKRAASLLLAFEARTDERLAAGSLEVFSEYEKEYFVRHEAKRQAKRAAAMVIDSPESPEPFRRQSRSLDNDAEEIFRQQAFLTRDADSQYTSRPASFTNFADFPIELRNRIWKFAMPGKRNIGVTFVPLPSIWVSKPVTPYTVWGRRGEQVQVNRISEIAGTPFMYEVLAPRDKELRALLQVNREARAETLSFFKPAFGIDYPEGHFLHSYCCPPKTWVNWSTDRICFYEPKLAFCNDLVFKAALQPLIDNKARNVALEISRGYQFLPKLIRCLPDLKELELWYETSPAITPGEGDVRLWIKGHHVNKFKFVDMMEEDTSSLSKNGKLFVEKYTTTLEPAMTCALNEINTRELEETDAHALELELERDMGVGGSGGRIAVREKPKVTLAMVLTTTRFTIESQSQVYGYITKRESVD